MLDQFCVEEFEMFPSLHTFINLDKESKSFIVVAVCETHLLVFKEDALVKSKKSLHGSNYGSFSGVGSVKVGERKVFLSRYCDLQCISNVNYNKDDEEIILTVFKYRSIKSFNEF